MRRSSDKQADGAKSSGMSLPGRIAELEGIIERLTSRTWTSKTGSSR